MKTIIAARAALLILGGGKEVSSGGKNDLNSAGDKRGSLAAGKCRVDQPPYFLESRASALSLYQRGDYSRADKGRVYWKTFDENNWKIKL